MATRRRPAFDQWARYRALAGAWERLRSRNLAAGVDRVTSAEFAREADSEIDVLCDELRTGRYRPRPLSCFLLPTGGLRREISIPSMRDRVVQEALRPQLEEALASRLSPHCHGYVRGRSTLTAQHEAAALIKTGHVWIELADVAHAFARVRRQILCQRVKEWLDSRTACVVARLLGAPRQRRRGGVRRAPPRGIPLGQPIAPCCFNIYLSSVDAKLERAGIVFVRYADDILILAATEAGLDAARPVLDSALADVSLRLNPTKSRRAMVRDDPFAFLGHFLASGHVFDDVRKPREPAASVAAASNDATGDQPPLARTLYLQKDGSRVAARSGHAVVYAGSNDVQRIPLRDVDRVIVLAGVGFSSVFLGRCLERGIPVHFAVRGRGQSVFGTLVRYDAEAPLRTRSQVESHGDEDFRLTMARAFVAGKIANACWLLRRLRAGRRYTQRLNKALDRVKVARDRQQLLGIEGAASAAYYRGLSSVLRAEFQFSRRSRRPPRDPFNSLLSFGYTLLFLEMRSAVAARRLSPFIGYLHALHDNHAALVSDAIEEFRAPIVDRFCVRIVNRRVFRVEHFETRSGSKAVLLKPKARRRFLEQWEAFLQAPLCRNRDGHLLDTRRTLDRQATRLVDTILARNPDYVPFDAAGELASVGKGASSAA